MEHITKHCGIETECFVHGALCMCVSGQCYITVLDGIFDDAEAWGVDTLKGWIDDYESCRFTAIDSHTAVITSEYNMECLMEWLKRNTPIAEITEC